MIVVFALTNLPGLNASKKTAYSAEADKMVDAFLASVDDDSVYAQLLSGNGIVELIDFSNQFDAGKKSARSEAKLDKVHKDSWPRIWSSIS